MDHKKSNVVVYESTNYSKFSMINGNRALNEHKIKRIITQIEHGNDMLRYYPIQVHTKGIGLEILDGQHRFFISKELNRPVYYILVSEKKPMPEIANVNSNVEKWKANDFINCYTKVGNKNYKQLQEFLDKYRFSVGVCLSLLDNGTPGSSTGGHAELTEKFQQGKFVVNKMNEAVEIAEMAKQFEKFKNWRGRVFILALYRIREAKKVDIADLVVAFHKNMDMLTEQATFKDYIVKFEQIMNIGKRKRLIIT